MTYVPSFVALLLATLLVTHGQDSNDMLVIGLDKPLDEYPLPRLPFAFEAMEPNLDTETMKMHYSIALKNHTFNLNKLLKKWKSSVEDKTLAKSSLANMWRNERRIPVRFQEEFYKYGGGYLNHLLYFATMSPPETNQGKSFSKDFAHVVHRSNYSVTEIKKKMLKLAEDEVFGSGWIFLVREVQDVDGRDYLNMTATSDEMSPLNNPKTAPILALDMWEHAYLKKYGFSKRAYFNNWWQTIDWLKVEQIFNWWREVDGYVENSSLSFL